jgi:hypothetical protein
MLANLLSTRQLDRLPACESFGAFENAGLARTDGYESPPAQIYARRQGRNSLGNPLRNRHGDRSTLGACAAVLPKKQGTRELPREFPLH